MRTAPLFLATLLSSFIATAYAHDHGKHDHSHDHGDTLSAHQHGVAALNLVIEGNEVEIELDSPADNLVGFEYLPTSDADKKKVKDTMATLRDTQRLFAFPAGAGCTSTEVELKSPLFTAVEEKGHNHKHDDHKHEHNKHSHDHDHGHDHADGSTHNDIEAHYHFTCENTAALNQIEVKLFEVFPGTEKLILQAVGERGQQGGELTPASNIIRF